MPVFVSSPLHAPKNGSKNIENFKGVRAAWNATASAPLIVQGVRRASGTSPRALSEAKPTRKPCSRLGTCVGHESCHAPMRRWISSEAAIGTRLGRRCYHQFCWVRYNMRKVDTE